VVYVSIRNYKKCPTCNREISLSNYNKHVALCTGPKIEHPKEYIILDNGMCKCNYCDKVYSKNGIGTHIWRTHGEGINWTGCNDGYRDGTKTIWNKGQSKECNASVKKSANTLSRRYKSGELTLNGPFARGYWTKQKRKERSQARKQFLKEHPGMHPNRILANNKKHMSYPERIAYDYLKRNNIVFEYQKSIDRFFVDFCINKTVIEVDGEYWHNEEMDKIRDNILNNNGYVVYRIKAKENIEERLKKLLSVLGQAGYTT